MPKNDFTDSVSFDMNSLNQKEAPGSFPAAAPSTPAKPRYKTKYARFTVEEEGCPELEAIMDDVLSGKKILEEEKWYFTKDGDSVVVIKYYSVELPVAAPDGIQILGRRRLRKALAKQEQKNSGP